MEITPRLTVQSSAQVSEKHALKSIKKFMTRIEESDAQFPEDIKDKVAIIVSALSAQSGSSKVESCETPKVKRKREKSEGIVEGSSKKKSKKSKKESE